jgi:nitrate/TMAO reductase-like tetraheme cytochrome c subunit
MMGTIDTREKFEDRRLYLAERVWGDMKESDSKECRNCHALGHMDLDRQELSASRKHTLKRQTERGETCIDCHQGVAHTLPEGWEDVYDEIDAAKQGAD